MDSEGVKSKPLSKEETKILIELIRESKIINNKKTNATTNKQKVEEWDRIAATFNSSASRYPRTSQQLRLKWENLKKNSRKRNAKIRMNQIKKLGNKVFDAKIMKGHAPKVPQQTNLTDCGVYVLVYVEKFFKETAMDLTVPMTGWTNWFTEQEVKIKREDIAVTIKTLAWVHNPKIEHELPHISV